MRRIALAILLAFIVGCGSESSKPAVPADSVKKEQKQDDKQKHDEKKHDDKKQEHSSK